MPWDSSALRTHSTRPWETPSRENSTNRPLICTCPWSPLIHSTPHRNKSTSSTIWVTVIWRTSKERSWDNPNSPVCLLVTSSRMKPLSWERCSNPTTLKDKRASNQPKPKPSTWEVRMLSSLCHRCLQMKATPMLSPSTTIRSAEETRRITP